MAWDSNPDDRATPAPLAFGESVLPTRGRALARVNADEP